MQNKRVTSELLKNVKGYESKQAYVAPFANQPADKMNQTDSENLKDHVRRDKIVSSLKEAIEKCEIKDGMTISFHHHFRAGDKLLMMVVDTLAEMGIKNLRIAASSLTSAHNGLVAHIENGVVNRIETSGLRGKLATAVSEGILEYPAVIRSHGGRARAISSGDVKIDVAFIAASSADCMGNANGVVGKSICGSLGYAKVDAQYANKVVVVTDTLVSYPNFPQSIPQTQVDYVVIVDEVGDSNGIMSGATRFTNNPKELLMAKRVLNVMKASGLFVDGFSMQTGTGGASLAVTRFVKEEIKKRDIKLSYALGGITGPMVELLEEGYVSTLFDTQSFDLTAAQSVGKNERHVEVSADFYASIGNKSAAVNKLDFVILSALEIDTDFNVNVISGSDGVIRAASGGHSDTAAMAKISILTAPLTRGRLSTIIDKVTTVVTPGSTVDVVVTDYGVTVNPNRQDLIEKFKAANLPLITMEELRAMAIRLVGQPKEIEFSDEVVAVVEYRDGSVIDTIRKIK
ncbi:citrate lyase subunit alpha [Romboutsia ilealis]|uniref:Citrate lyase alpha chain n=1 Tax=Romboutsia faecis TaxID=2764597 RepID=A0ABR7JNQ3_9FIRM|nr:citrate lyase subunit alpha [Romboutsia faecis]MBC5996485.1 citrate lyase subunit alpha [Romboutsia faecis]MRN24011.1 citrate lyase subunit alpha [Romboutsia ilealis]